MSKASKLRVMISSRCDDFFPVGQTKIRLSDIRRTLKVELEKLEIFDKEILEVWINEEAPPMAATWDSWDVCLEAIKDSDIVIAIANGHAGWAQTGGDIGICHAELATALANSPAKVRVVALPNIAITKGAEGARNKRFQEYLATQNLFRGGTVQTVDDCVQRAKEALRDAIISLARSGVRESSQGRFYSGQALDWSRLDFVARSVEMRKVLVATLEQRGNAKRDGDNVIIRLQNSEVLFVPQAMPAAFSVSRAREMVGQPFLEDHKLVPSLKGKCVGPIHLIACHRIATEAQASKMLGFPDATIVSAPFGVFAADNVQKVQFGFISNCRDETHTRHGVQRFFEWLVQTGELDRAVKRAEARARIIRVVADEASK